MSTDLVILIPALGRPQNVKPLMDSIAEATPDARVLFICDHEDTQQILAVNRDGRPAVPMCVTGNYAEKIRTGVNATFEPLIFLGADDLRFHAGWFEKAKAYLKDGIEVVGVNDLIPRRREQHATHFLLTREYAHRPTIDGKPGPLCQDYDHSYVDDELIATAKHREVYAYAADAVVEHRHPDVRTAEWDDTYRKGREQFRADGNLFRQRTALWT